MGAIFSERFPSEEDRDEEAILQMELLYKDGIILEEQIGEMLLKHFGIDYDYITTPIEEQN